LRAQLTILRQKPPQGKTLRDVPVPGSSPHNGARNARARRDCRRARVIEIDVKGDDAHVVSLLHGRHCRPSDFGEPMQRMVGTFNYWLRCSPQGRQICKYLHNTRWNRGNCWIYQNAHNAAEKDPSAPPRRKLAFPPG
jgi:hypothetical protein